MNPDEIPALDAWSYAGGVDPIDLAIRQVHALVEVYRLVQQRPEHLPPLPAWPEVTEAALVRKIVGALLDAQWKPPTAEQIDRAVREHKAWRAQYDAWWATKTEQEQALIVEFYSETGEYPPKHQPPTRPQLPADGPADGDAR